MCNTNGPTFITCLPRKTPYRYVICPLHGISYFCVWRPGFSWIFVCLMPHWVKTFSCMYFTPVQSLQINTPVLVEIHSFMCIFPITCGCEFDQFLTVFVWIEIFLCLYSIRYTWLYWFCFRFALVACICLFVAVLWVQFCM